MSARGYRPDIDGLRAIAVSSVVLYHAGFPLRSGFVGVDIFFVISGFLITGIVQREVAEGRFSYADFYARRARRILPALFALLLTTFIAGTILLSPSELSDLAISSATAVLGVGNVYFFKTINYFHPTADLEPMLMTWSLGVEEQFYVLFPIFLIALARRRRGAVLPWLYGITAASFLVGCAATWKWAPLGFYLLPARAWELGAGAILAAHRARGETNLDRRLADPISIAGLLALVIATFSFDRLTSWPGWRAALPVVGAAMLLVSEKGVVNRRLLSNRFLVGIGLISYSWYLWHWPLFTLIRLSVLDTPSRTTMLVATLVSIGLAYLSWRFVEQPFRLRIAPTAVALRRYSGAMSLVVLVGCAVVASDGMAGRFTADLRRVDQAVAGTHEDPCLASSATPNFSARCVRLAQRRPSIALIGDSHAAALGPAIRSSARAHNWGYAVLAKSACAQLVGVHIRKLGSPDHARRCAGFRKRSVDWILRHPSIKTVVVAGFWSEWHNPMNYAVSVESDQRARKPHEVLKTGLTKTVQTFRAAGKRVVLVEDTVTWPFNPARIMQLRTIPARAALQRFLQPDRSVPAELTQPVPAVDAIGGALRDTAQAQGVPLIRPRDKLCPGRSCRFALNGTLLYADHTHLTPDGAILALRSSDTALYEEAAFRAVTGIR